MKKFYKLAITYCAGAPDGQTTEEDAAIIGFATYLDRACTLIGNFNDHPDWCKESGLYEYEGLKLGQIVLDLNKTLAVIIHISKEGNFRLGLLNETGIFASTSSIRESIIPYNGERIQLNKQL